MARGSFEVAPGVFVAANCHHRKGGACGPCYARLVTALERVNEASFASDAQAIVEETFAAMRAEAPRGLKAVR